MQQRGRLLSALVRPLMWLAVFAAGFYNVFGVSIIPPYKTYITYQVYIVPGLLGIILLFHGMQSSLSMVYDREMGVMRLLLTAPLPRWVLLACKLVAGTALSVITCYVFLAVCILFDVTFEPIGWLYVLPALIVSGLMLGLAVAVSLGLHQAGREFRRRDELRDVSDVLLLVRALSVVEAARGRLGVRSIWISLVNPFTHAVEMIRFALYGMFEPVVGAGRRRLDGAVLPAGGERLRSAARHDPPHRAAGVSERDIADVRATSQIGLVDPLRDLLAHGGELLRRARVRGRVDRNLGRGRALDSRESRNSRSASPIASSTLWVTSSVVTGRRLTRSASSSRSRAASASSSDTNGSSSSSRSGSTAKARASATRRASPSESSPG